MLVTSGPKFLMESIAGINSGAIATSTSYFPESLEINESKEYDWPWSQPIQLIKKRIRPDNFIDHLDMTTVFPFTSYCRISGHVMICKAFVRFPDSKGPVYLILRRSAGNSTLTLYCLSSSANTTERGWSLKMNFPSVHDGNAAGVNSLSVNVGFFSSITISPAVISLC